MDFKKNPKESFKDLKKLSEKEARREVEDLREGINYHDYLYYVKNKPEISDAKYDKLFKRLQDLEEAFPGLKDENSPTKRVGAEPVDRLRKTKHEGLMLSLKSVRDDREVKAFLKSVSKKKEKKRVYSVEPKFDGLSVEAIYRKGKFDSGSTRGDGDKGENITKNLRTIGGILPELRDGKNLPFILAVRGEVFMRKKGFQELNKKLIENGKDSFANPRNAAAGIMRQLDSTEAVGKPFDIFFYEVMKCEGENFVSHTQALKKCGEWGLKTCPANEKCVSFRQIKKYHEKMEKKREKLDYEIDGIVVKVDDLESRKKLGTRHRNPRWAVAWKFSASEEVTTLRDIVVQVGTTGMLTPVALLEPVDVGGVTISRATLHNEYEVRKKNIHRGDQVKVARAGDVIPEVVKPIGKAGKKRGGKFKMPEKCPSCGAKVFKQGAYYFCPAGLSCKAQLKGRIIHYASREAMNIENLGEETAEEMIEKNMINDMADLYALSAADFKKLDSFADKSAKTLAKSIQSSKKTRLDTFLYALGIHHVGHHMARILARKYGTMEKLRKAKLRDLKKTPEVGDKIARSVTEFFKEKRNQKILEKLKKSGLRIEKMPMKRQKKVFRGKTFVFTGELEDFTRVEAEETVEELGAKAASNVSENTDYVVVGKDPGSKLREAKKRKVETIGEKRFKGMLKI